MPLYIINHDICTMETDAIVNAANSNLRHGGGVARAIAVAAGEEEMERASAEVAPCPVGGAVYTPGFALPAKYVIHAVGPQWDGGDKGEEELLRGAYRSSLELAEELGCSSLSFPLISSGIFGYPWGEAYRVAVETIEAYLTEHEMDVYLVLYSQGTRLPRNLEWELEAFIQQSSTPSFQACGAAPSKGSARPDSKTKRRGLFSGVRGKGATFESPVIGSSAIESPSFPAESYESVGFEEDACFAAAPMPRSMSESGSSLTEMLEHLDASFSEAVFSLIDAKGLTDPQVYNKVHMSRQSFSKLRQPGYHPKKTTAIVLALALELDLEQTQSLLARAGYTLSTSFPQDCVVIFLINNGIYDLATINQVLYERDLPLLSS